MFLLPNKYLKKKTLSASGCRCVLLCVGIALHNPDSVSPFLESLLACLHCDWHSFFRPMRPVMHLAKTVFISHHTLWSTLQSVSIWTVTPFFFLHTLYFSTFNLDLALLTHSSQMAGAPKLIGYLLLNVSWAAWLCHLKVSPSTKELTLDSELTNNRELQFRLRWNFLITLFTYLLTKYFFI